MHNTQLNQNEYSTFEHNNNLVVEIFFTRWNTIDFPQQVGEP